MTRMVYATRVVVVAAAIALACSSGKDGATGPRGADGTSATALGTLTGTITDAYGNRVAGAKAAYEVVGQEEPVEAIADADGVYALAMPPGPRKVTFTATGYEAYAQEIEVAPDETGSLDVMLNPQGPVAVTAVRTDKLSPVLPGSQVAVKAAAFVFDPAITGTPTYQWSVAAGPAVTFDDATSATPKVTLASAAAFKKRLVELAAPRFTWNADEPPVNVDRYQVVPLSYEQVLSKANATKLKVVVTVGGESYEQFVTVSAKLPAVPSTGLATVPVKSPVVLQGQFPFKKDGAYVFAQRTDWDWRVVGPEGPVQVNDASTPYPDFVPSVAGAYFVVEGATTVLTVYAGTYRGAMEAAGKVDDVCTGCHAEGGMATDQFTKWSRTGHAKVIWAGLMEPRPEGHYAQTCTPCHTVGNGQTGADGFADALGTTTPSIYAEVQGSVLAEQKFWEAYPAAGKVAGIQCENCHGPQLDTTRHTKDVALRGVGNARVTYSSGPCATCHARAPKHGRYPQWVNSGHASYATFTYNSDAEGNLSVDCAVCHSAQGFKAFRAAMPTAGGYRGATALPAGLTVRNAQPITCPACHVSHDEGDASEAEWQNLAKVGPTEGSTYMLPSGFEAIGVGKGALCIACHNSRNAWVSGKGAFLHEDGDPEFGTTIGKYTAPHEACQGDVLLGRNAYWLGASLYASPQTRSKHSYITDTCVTCHMEKTTLDLSLSEEGQTRHDFKATPDVCNACHGAYSTESVQAVFADRFLDLRAAAGKAILRLKYDDAVPANTTALLVANRSGQVDVTTNGVTERWFIGDKAGADAFLYFDPTGGGTIQALVSGCGTPVVNAEGLPAADCQGFLHAAPGVTAVGRDAQHDAVVKTNGVNEVVARALWNAVLVQDDASKGVHNPSFTFDVMDRTIAHVNALER